MLPAGCRGAISAVPALHFKCNVAARSVHRQDSYWSHRCSFIGVGSICSCNLRQRRCRLNAALIMTFQPGDRSVSVTTHRNADVRWKSWMNRRYSVGIL
jgi:hypothetical protein